MYHERVQLVGNRCVSESANLSGALVQEHEQPQPVVVASFRPVTANCTDGDGTKDVAGHRSDHPATVHCSDLELALILLGQVVRSSRPCDLFEDFLVVDGVIKSPFCNGIITECNGMGA